MSTTNQAAGGAGGTSVVWRIAAIALPLFIGVFGLAMAAGGIWLVAVGGSSYYALAGLALLAATWLLLRRRRAGQSVMAAVWGASLAWALWEVGFNGWGLVPRVVGVTGLFMLALVLSPVINVASATASGGRRLKFDLAQRCGLGLAVAVLLGLLFLVSRETFPDVAGQPVAASGASGAGGAGADWAYYGGDAKAQRYSTVAQITPANVDRLERAFVFHTGDLPARGERYSPANTPLKIGNDLLVCSAKNILIAVDAASGKEKWRFDPKVPSQAIAHAAVCRGVAVYTAPDLPPDAACKTRVISNTLDARLVAVDIRDGKPCADFGVNGQVDLWQDLGKKVPGWYSPTAVPTVVRGMIVTGAQVRDGQDEDAPSGVVRGYHAVTGKLAWAWDLGNPDNVHGPKPGQTYTRGTPNMWTSAVGDEQLGLVYLPISNSSIDYYGSNRSAAENKYSDSLVAVDVTTGRDVWHFQAMRHDLWDYDLGSQPTLLDYPGADGKPVAAVLLPTKQGDLYILDRATGKPLIPVGEVKAPKLGSVEPAFVAATQPISGWHSLRKADKTEADMWGFSPVDQLMCRIQFRQSNYAGYLTPPSVDRPWIQYPGYNGGSDWGSVAIDPVRRVLIANYNDIPNRSQLVPRATADAMGVQPIYASKDANAKAAGKGEGEGGASVYPQINAPYAISVNAGWRNLGTGVPCTAPPYGGIRAISLDTGKTLWDGPLGTARRNGPFGIPSGIPFNIGLPNNGGAVVTAGGLVFIAAATDNLFRAIDIRTGRTVWQDVLPAGGQANPMAYEINGQQYIVIAATGHAFMETGNSDAIIAYKLRP
ncbi:pyrroloquinoline quinone-dependent dehydrogenase [Duganella sp. FT27W]|uniref:pyrroloquinoline quinone-dependent dehydrogenase n=1 Tax=Duganella sp. FT27W TaxID=2654636 RepID=UPI00128DB899|nr:pyrroloquinoline quinone-dependent dehydrogenase [Duganella sp. FT27W]MPQ55279.1 membrane-bound PQQ-dependent dehydrogenase, glucose/quinate/shikimate family [Duganella sp. FT27W]